MSENDRVLVDTSLWVGFLKGHPDAVALLTRVRKAHQIVVCGQIKLEVLQGSRDVTALAKLEREMGSWDYEAEQPEDFLDAARTYARLRWKGITVPSPDCLIASVAKRCGLQVCATDPHFAKIPDLRLFPI